MTRSAKKCALLICCIMASSALMAVAFLRSSVGPSSVFKRYVCDPIPQSVQDIRVRRLWELSGHTYLMHFKIGQDDLPSILALRPFREVSKVTYEGGWLSWDLDPSRGESLMLHRARERGLEWFRPDNWKHSKAYRCKERLADYRGHWQVLIYDREFGEAYFVEYQEGHW